MVGCYTSAIVQDLTEHPVWETREQLLKAVNEVRAQYRLQPVYLYTPFNCAALSWSKRIWRMNICTHTDPQTGQQFWHRITMCGGRIFSQTTEIVSCGDPDINSAIQGWLISPSHRQALLNPYVRTVGIGVAGPALKDAKKFYTIILAQ